MSNAHYHTAIRLLASFCVFITLAGCSTYSKYKNMKKPAVKLETVKVEDVNFKTAKFMFGIQVDNPNEFPLKVDSVKYDIELAGKHMTTESIDTPTEVGANTKTIVQLPLTVQIADLFNGIGDFLRNDKTAYRVHGAARVGLFSLPFDEAGEFRITDKEVQHIKK